VVPRILLSPKRDVPSYTPFRGYPQTTRSAGGS